MKQILSPERVAVPITEAPFGTITTLPSGERASAATGAISGAESPIEEKSS
jgi:hypothetical protein